MSGPIKVEIDPALENQIEVEMGIEGLIKAATLIVDAAGNVSIEIPAGVPPQQVVEICESFGAVVGEMLSP